MIVGRHGDAVGPDPMAAPTLLIRMDLEALKDVDDQDGIPGEILGPGAHHQGGLGQLVDTSLDHCGIEVAAGHRLGTARSVGDAHDHGAPRAVGEADGGIDEQLDGIVLASRLPFEVKLVGLEVGGNRPFDDSVQDLA